MEARAGGTQGGASAPPGSDTGRSWVESSVLFHAAVQASRRPSWGPPGCGGRGDWPCGPRLVIAPEGLTECAPELRLTLREGLIFLF